MTDVRVATWNLANLFLAGAEGGPPTQAAYDAKLDSLAFTISALEPDILAVQEVGDPIALKDLAARVGGTWHVETADPDDRGIRVGFMSRHNLTKVKQISTFPEHIRPIQIDDTDAVLGHMGRPALRARISIKGSTIDLLSAHLKSKLLSYPAGRFAPRNEGERARFSVYALHRRAAESATVREAATSLLAAGPERRVIVLGDLNDEPRAATTQILYGPTGSEIGTRGFDRPDAGDAWRLWNLADLIPDTQRFSRVFQGHRELIDHILVSHALVRGVAAGGVMTGPLPTESIGDSPADSSELIGSDHRPVLAVIQV